MIKKNYNYLFLIAIAFKPILTMNYAVAIKAAQELLPTSVAKLQKLAAIKKAELKGITESLLKQLNKKLNHSVTVENDFVLIQNEEDKKAIAIFEVPDKEKLYFLTEEQKKQAMEQFQIQFAENKGAYKIVHFLYHDKNVLPANKAQAVYLLYSPYLKNTVPASNASSLPNPLNEHQKKVIGNTNNLSLNPLRIAQVTKFSQLRDILQNKKPLKKEGFLGSTKIKTENGFSNIEDIKVGDKVISYDEKNRSQVLRSITSVDSRKLSQHMQIQVGDEIIHVAEDHQFYVPYTEAWISARDLKDSPELRKFIDLNIKEIKEVQEPLEVIRISVEGKHNFYVTDKNILVHNFNALPSLIIGCLRLNSPVMFPMDSVTRMLREHALVKSDNHCVSAGITKEQYQQLESRRLYESKFQELSYLNEQLLNTKNELENIHGLWKENLVNFTPQLLYQANEINYCPTFQPNLKDELTLSKDEANTLKNVRESHLTHLEKQIENIQITLGFHFNELIEQRDKAIEKTFEAQNKLSALLDSCHNDGDLTQQKVQTIYEATLMLEDSIQTVAQRNNELLATLDYYKNPEKGTIVKATTNISGIVKDQEGIVHALEIYFNEQKQNINQIKNEIEKNFSIIYLKENIKTSITQQRNAVHKKELEIAKNKKLVLHFPKVTQNTTQHPIPENNKTLTFHQETVVEKPKEQPKKIEGSQPAPKKTDAQAPGKPIEDILKDTTRGDETAGKSKIFEKPGSHEDADKDFESMKPSDIEYKKNGKVKVGSLPDGRRVNVRDDSTDGRPTLEVYNPKNGQMIKIRYGSK